jgi:hypothetical protein
LKLILVQGERLGSTLNPLQSPAPFVEEPVFSPTYVLGFFVKKQIIMTAWIYDWVFCSLPLVFPFVLCQYHAVFITMAL